MTSPCLKGHCCPLAAFGHSRDGKRVRMQITFGLLCAADGCRVAVEVFPGNASDSSTVAAQMARLRTRSEIVDANFDMVHDGPYSLVRRKHGRS